MLNEMERLGWPELSRTQSMVMAYLKPEGVRSSHIASRQNVSRQAIHQTLNDLKRLGLVEYETDPNNASAKLVFPTVEGKKLIRDAKRSFSKLESQLSANLGQKYMQQLTVSLVKAVDVAKTLDDES